MTLTPTHGARIELVLESGGDAARYRIEVRTPDAQFEGSADLDRAGARIAWKTEPPKWVADTALGLAKTLQKNHVDDRSWPSRLHRWRESR